MAIRRTLPALSNLTSQCLRSYLTALSNAYIPGIRFAGSLACSFILVVEAHATSILRGRFHGSHGSLTMVQVPKLWFPLTRWSFRALGASAGGRYYYTFNVLHMDVTVASMGAFRQVHALLFISVEASIPFPEDSRDAASVHGSVGEAVMDDSTEHPLVFSAWM